MSIENAVSSALRSVWAMAATLLAPLWLLALTCVGRLRLPVAQRLGGGPRHQAGPVVWFHAASAGDVRAATVTARVLRDSHPEWQLVLTVQTTSGLTTGQAIFPGSVWATPLEGWPWMDRFVRRLRPDVLVLEYLELWPRMIATAHRSGCAVVLQNARIHPRRLPRYDWLGSPWRWMLRTCRAVRARSDADASRLGKLGLSASASLGAGVHTKYALLEPSDARIVAQLAERHRLPMARHWSWIGASLHRSEAELAAAAHARLLEAQPEARCLVVPRYPTHAQSFVDAFARLDIDVALVRTGSSAASADARAYVVATMGELSVLCGLAAVAVIGGTFCARGGQNPLEAVAAGCVVVAGPQTQQIDDELQQIGAVRVVGTADALSAALSAVLGDVDIERPHADEDCVSNPRSALADVVAAAELSARIIAEAIVAEIGQRRGRAFSPPRVDV